MTKSGEDPIREVRGRIPQSLKIAFEVYCARRELSQAMGIQEAITDWLIKNGAPTAVDPIEPAGDRGPKQA